MKQFAMFLLTAFLMISLVACGNGADVVQTFPSEGTSEPTAPTQTATENTVTEPSENVPADPTNPTNTVTEPPENVTADPTNPTESTVHEHDFSIEQKTVPATCTSKGYTIYECECGETKNGNETAIVPHDYVKTVIPPTEESWGYTINTCYLCQHTYEDNRVEPLQPSEKPHTHSYSQKQVSATCTSGGYILNACACGDEYRSDETGELGHDYTLFIAVDPKCEKIGMHTYRCTRCTSHYTETLKATGHKNTKTENVAATCTSCGKTKTICSDCGKLLEIVDNASAPALNHKWELKSDTATCTADGKKNYTCTRCSETKSEVSEATGHVKTHTEEKASTCDSNGYKKVICDKCNIVVSEEKLQQLSHAWREVNAAEGALAYREKYDDNSYCKYENHNEFLCNQCSLCLNIDEESIHYIYSQQEIAERMLALINAERKKLGYGYLELKIGEPLLEFADVRAEEISTKFDHFGSSVGGASENIAKSTQVYNNAVEHFFNKFFTSTEGYKENMLAKDARYFGCDIYWDGTSLNCVQLFWTEAERWSWNYEKLVNDEFEFVPVTRFLVASDTHVSSSGDAQCKRIAKMFEEAYALCEANEHYKKLDAAVFAGDLTNTGTKAQFDAFAAATKNALRGNTKRYAVAAKSHDCSSMGANAIAYFSELLGQPSDFHVVINGFHFIGISASNTRAHYTNAQVAWLDAQLLEATRSAPQQPVFVFQHEHISNTVFGSYDQDGWGMDTFSAVLEKYPQVIDFSGHSHYPANDPRSIWQGAYTAVGTGGLYYAEFTVDDQNCIHPDKYETVAQALVVEIDAENRVLVKVLDVTANRILCVYLIDNVTSTTKETYSHEARKNAAEAPTFADNAKLTVKKSGTNTKITVPQASVAQYSGNEVYLYRLTVTDAYGRVVLTDWELSKYYIADRPDSITFSVQLPNNAKHISVAAEDVWGHLSKPLTADL